MAVTDSFLIVVETTTDTSTSPPTVTVIEKMIATPLGAVCADVPILWTGSATNIAALVDRTGPPAGKQEDVLVCVIAGNDTYVTASNSDYTPPGGGGNPTTPGDDEVTTGFFTAP